MFDEAETEKAESLIDSVNFSMLTKWQRQDPRQSY